MRPMYEVSTLAVEFMSRMMEHTAEMAGAVDRINDGKAFFVARMRGLGFHVLPTHGNFMHVAFGESGPRIHAALSSQVLYRKNFDQSCLAGYSRFSAAPRPVMARVADLIEHSLAVTAS
jgi:histidinol-phosphate aminotransferase